MNRCFGTGKDFYETYHDHEWGVPVRDDRLLFEMLILEGAQAGLSWETILKRRSGYKQAFHNFDIETIAHMSDLELEKLKDCPDIIRNRSKIFAVRQNARVFLAIQKEYGSFATYLWSFVGNTPIIGARNHFKEIPPLIPESIALSKDLKKRGMNFVGPTIMYAYMQAVGLVNDHLTSCWRHQALIRKPALRDMLMRIRAQLPPERQEQAASSILSCLQNILGTHSRVLSFAPLPSEVDVRVINLLLASQKKLLLPRVENLTLAIYLVSDPTSELIRSPFGIFEPDPTRCPQVEKSSISCVLVPGLGFDKENLRLGFGKGYYDRLLQGLSCLKIGIGFKEQLVDSIPREPHDVELDRLLLG